MRNHCLNDDVHIIAKAAVGRYWRIFDDEQKSKFDKTFSKLSIAIYAGRFDNVIADGVSDFALKRSDYSAYLKEKEFDIFLEKLNEKIVQYSR